MDKFSAGDVTVTVSDPYPCWITIQQSNHPAAISIPHDAIGDVIAILIRAQQHARLRLSAHGSSAQEAD